MATHSTIVGGSTAGRLLNCPGSYQATLQLPPSAEISSEYADEGTAMHEVMNRLMQMRHDAAWHGVGRNNSFPEATKLIGQTFHDRILTQADVDTMISPALHHLHELENAYENGDSFEVWSVEQSVRFPGIPGAYGTCDLILGNSTHVLHVDWKFGQGVGVKAVYEADDGGETVNAQLMFYATAAMSSARHFYSGKKMVVIAIIQPRSADPLTHTPVSRKEIKWFAEDLQKAVVAALGYDPRRTKGEWCRFAPCKVNCPLWTGPILELAALMPVQRDTAPFKQVTAYGEYLARAKSLVDMLSLFSKEVNDQLHAYLTDGGKVPGWRLKDKVKQRQWVDENTVYKALRDLGFDTHDIWQRKLATFQSADATAKKLGVVIPDELRVAPPSTETTVCRTDDPAPEATRQIATEEFAGMLKQLNSPKG